MKSEHFLKEGFVEDASEVHADHEVQMARSDLFHAAEDALVLHKLLRNVSEQQGLEGWVAAKITLASDYLKTVREYIEYELMTAASEQPMLPIAEGSGSKEKQKTPYRDINSPEYRAAADKQKQRMAKDAAAEPGKKLADKIAKKGVAEGSSDNKYSNLSNRGVNRGINRAADDFNRLLDLDQAESPHYKTQHQQDTKKRLKTKPMAGPKGVLPEQSVAEGSLEEVSLDLAKRVRDKAEYYVDMDYDDMRDRPEGYSEKQRRKFQRYIDRKEPRAKGDRDWDPPKQGVAEGSDEKQSFKVSYHNPKTRQDKVVKIKARNKDEVLDYCANKGYKNVHVKQDVSEDDSAVQAFLSKGGKIQQLPYKKPRKADKTDYGSKHIGGSGDKMKASRTGTAAKTQGNKVAGMSEGSVCNHTMEGKSCPTHGLKECPGYKSSIEETTAGSVAGVVNPTPKNKAKVGTLFGGTYKQKKTKA